MVEATCGVTLNLTGVAGQTRVVPSTLLPGGLEFQVTPVSVHVSIETKSAVADAVGAPACTGMRRMVAPAGAVATPATSNFTYASRLLSLVVEVSRFTARSACVPKFVFPCRPLRTLASASAPTLSKVSMTSCGRSATFEFSLDAKVTWLLSSLTIDSSRSDSFLSPACDARTSAVTSNVSGSFTYERNSRKNGSDAGLLFQLPAPSV